DRQRLVAILDATPDVVAIFTAAWSLVYLNPAGRNLLGVRAGEAVTERNLSGLLTPLGEQQLRLDGVPGAVADGVWSGESELLDQAGDEVPVLLTLIVHDGDDAQERYFSMLARDISERKS